MRGLDRCRTQVKKKLEHARSNKMLGADLKQFYLESLQQEIDRRRTSVARIEEIEKRRSSTPPVEPPQQPQARRAQLTAEGETFVCAYLRWHGYAHYRQYNAFIFKPLLSILKADVALCCGDSNSLRIELLRKWCSTAFSETVASDEASIAGRRATLLAVSCQTLIERSRVHGALCQCRTRWRVAV